MIIQSLGEHIDQVRGVTYRSIDSSTIPLEGYLPILRSNNIEEGSINFIDLVFVPKERIKDVQLLKKGDILLTASTGSLKVIGKNGQIESDYIGAFGAFCKVIRPKTSVNPKYLKFYFQTNNYRTTIRNIINGANINNIKNEHIDNLKIPLPPLETQRKIAAILDKANELVQNDKKTLEKYDQLAQSVFLEMFGDPIRNPKRWESCVLNELGDWKSGGTPSRQIKEHYIGNIPWLTSGELESIYTYDSVETINIQAINASSAKIIEKGSLLLGMYDTAALKSTINMVECSCNQAIAYAKLNNEQANVLFVYYFIQFGKEYLRRMQRGVRQKNMNLSMIKDLKVFYPPIELQNRFAEIISHIETQKQLARQSLQKSEELFLSLLQGVFKGELIGEKRYEINNDGLSMAAEEDTRYNIK